MIYFHFDSSLGLQVGWYVCLKEHVSHGVTPPRVSRCFIVIEEQFGKNSTEVNFSEGC